MPKPNAPESDPNGSERNTTKIARFSWYLSYFFHSPNKKIWGVDYFGVREKIWLDLPDLPDLPKIAPVSSGSAHAELD